MNRTTKMFFDEVMAAMQNAEERGGPEGAEYVLLMEAIAKEARQRAENLASYCDEGAKALLAARGWATPEPS